MHYTTIQYNKLYLTRDTFYKSILPSGPLNSYIKITKLRKMKIAKLTGMSIDMKNWENGRNENSIYIKLSI